MMQTASTLADIDRYLESQTGRVTVDEARPYFRRAAGPNAFLLLHGWSASPESLRFLADGLVAAGYSVLAPTLSGHGASAEDMGRFGPVDWFREAHEAARLLADVFGHVHVLGVSMGGALAIQLAACAPHLVKSLTTVNAPVFMRSATFADDVVNARSGPYLEHWSPAQFFGPPVAEFAYRNRLKKSGADLYAMCGLARDLLARVHCPTLVCQSIRDNIVPSSNAEEILDRINAVSKRAVYFDKSFHVSQLDIDRDVVTAEAVAFARQVDRPDDAPRHGMAS